MSRLFDCIVTFVSSCLSSNSEHVYHRTIEMMKSKKNQQFLNDMQSELRLPFDLEFYAFEMFKEVQKKNVSITQLVEFMEVAYKMAKVQIDSQPKIFPVWTGPHVDRSSIRLKTYETVKYLIDSAETEIFIVGYSFSFKHDSVKELMRSIEMAVERNCRINIIVNNVEKNFQEILTHWEKEHYQLNVYHWLGSKENDFTSLHAKIVIIDQEKLLLTSANFSYHGFQKNIETGVVIENHKISRDIWNQYHSLIRENQVVRAY